MAHIYLEGENLETNPCYNPLTELIDCPFCDGVFPMIRRFETHLIAVHIDLPLQQLEACFVGRKKEKIRGSKRRYLSRAKSRQHSAT